jgi:hypothetical protein
MWPYSNLIEREERLIVGDELERYYSEHLTKLTLWDFVRGDHRLITSDHILELVQKMKERSYLRQDGKTAIVTHKDADFGMTRMLQAYAESQKIEFEIEVFKDIEKAKEWLGVSSLQIND